MVIQTITIECPECGGIVEVDRMDFDLVSGEVGVLMTCCCPECMEDLCGVVE